MSTSFFFFFFTWAVILAGGKGYVTMEDSIANRKNRLKASYAQLYEEKEKEA